MSPKIYLCILLIPFYLFGQHQDKSSMSKIYKTNKLLKISDEQIALNEFFTVKTADLGIGQSEMKLVKKLPTKTNVTHYKYQQYYKEYPVFKNIYILHEQEGKVVSANGSLYPNIEIPTQVLLSKEEAYRKANSCHFIQSRKDAFDKNVKMQTAKLISSELVVTDRIYPNFSGRYTMAYAMILESEAPLLKVEYLIDANTGRVISSQSKIHHIDRPSIAKTKYYGTQMIISDSIAPTKFVLRDNGRNITTYTNKRRINREFIDSDGYWDQFNGEKDEVALDAHYCTSRFHDMLVDLFDYKGIDGVGSAMNPVVHAEGGQTLVNAYWDGENAYFGNGDCLHNPLTTLSVVAHEFMHGVTMANSNLEYQSESGALNEAYSDIFGKACEYIYDSLRFSWELEPIFKKTNYSEDFRSFSDPNRLEMPKAYKGKFWQDYADVHINSSVLNHWYYLLVKGDTAMNEFGKSYSIAKVPFKNVLEVLFLCQTSFLTATSDYVEMKELSLLACEELFGQGQIFQSMVEAWRAVNVIDGSNLQVSKSFAVEINFDSTYYCSKIAIPSYSLNIINSDKGVIPKNTVIHYKIYYGSKFRESKVLMNEIVLKDDLLAGEELVVDLTGTLVLDHFGKMSCFVELYFDNPENIISFDYINIGNFNTEKNDFSLEIDELEIISCSVEIKEILTDFIVRNHSCDPIISGTKLTIQFKDDFGVIYSNLVTLDRDLFSGDELYWSSLFEYPNRDLSVTAELIYFKDLNTTNNIVNGLHYSLIKVPKKFTFDDLDHKKYFLEINNLDTIYNSGNEKFFAATGSTPISKFVDAPCPDLERNFGGNSSASLSACIDASGLGKTTLSFDLIQYRTDSSKFKEFNEKTSLFQLQWHYDNMIEFHKIISDQVEAQKKTYTFTLPENFIGIVDLGFYTRLGLGSVINAKALDYDVILLDNLEFKTITSNNESSSDKKLVLETNPSKFHLSLLGNTADVESYRILNSLGQLVRNIESSDRNRVDISSLIEGYYLLEVIFNNSKKQVLPFVKN
jgi:Zn-dependent metalloprotease